METPDVDILSLIPHRPPIVMVSKLIIAEEHQFISELHIKKGNIFLNDKYLEEAGMIENMAQTALAGANYLEQLEVLPNILLAAVQDLKVYDLPIEGTTIQTSIKPVHKVMNMMSVAGKVECEGKLLAEGILKFFILNNKI